MKKKHCCRKLPYSCWSLWETLSETCRYWFRRFKNGHLDAEGRKHSEQPEECEDEELNEDLYQTQEQTMELLSVNQLTIPGVWKPWKWLKSKTIRCHLNWNQDMFKKGFCLSEMLLQRQKKKLFLHCIVTGDEKWIYYDNLNQKIPLQN